MTRRPGGMRLLASAVAVLLLVLADATRPAGDAPAAPRSEAVREALSAAVEAGDEPALDALVRQHRAQIVAGYAAWMASQRELSGEALARSQAMLEALAARFEAEGDRTLRGLLSGVAAAGRTRGWAVALRDAQKLADAGDCATAEARLDALAGEMRGWHGPAIAALDMTLNDLRGACRRRSGDTDAALAATYRAYEHAAALENREALATYSLRMAELYHARGATARAREWAEAGAGILRTDGRVDEADAVLEAFPPALGVTP